jgi:hypothetical protein
MRPISELRFSHGQVLLKFHGAISYDLGCILDNGYIQLKYFSGAVFIRSRFAGFLPPSEIAQLQEGK